MKKIVTRSNETNTLVQLLFMDHSNKNKLLKSLLLLITLLLLIIVSNKQILNISV